MEEVNIVEQIEALTDELQHCVEKIEWHKGGIEHNSNRKLEIELQRSVIGEAVSSVTKPKAKRGRPRKVACAEPVAVEYFSVENPQDVA